MSDRKHAAAWPLHPQPSLRPASDGAPGFRDRASFEAAVRPHLDAMSAAARAVVRSPDLAADVVQDVLLRLWQRGWLSEDPRGALCLLARQAGKQALRANRRRCFHEACASSDECLFEDPSEASEREERRTVVRRLVAELKPEHRALLERTLEGEVEYQTLAREFALPVGTVRSRLHRARNELKRRLESTELQRSVA